MLADFIGVALLIALWLVLFPFAYRGFNRWCDKYEAWCERIIDRDD